MKKRFRAIGSVTGLLIGLIAFILLFFHHSLDEDLNASELKIYHEIPKEDSVFLKLTTPQSKFVTFENHITVSGYSRYAPYGYPVFVNGEQVSFELKSDGSSFTTLSKTSSGTIPKTSMGSPEFKRVIELKNRQKQWVQIVFLKPDFSVITITRPVLKLELKFDKVPSVFDYVYVTNLPEFSIPKINLTAPITRAELAQVLTLLDPKKTEMQARQSERKPTKQSTKKGQASTNEPRIFNDVSESTPYAQAIRWVADTGVMSGFPNGNFNPSQPVTKLEFIVSMVRAMRTPLTNASNASNAFNPSNALSPSSVPNTSDTSIKPESPGPFSGTSSRMGGMAVVFREIPENHWAWRHVQAALEAGILEPPFSKVSPLNPDMIVTWQTVLAALLKNPSIKEQINAFTLFKETPTTLPDSVKEYIGQNKKRLIAQRDIQFLSPQNNDDVTVDKVNIQGVAIPPIPFEFYKEKVVPDDQGQFSVAMSLSPGAHVYDYTFFDQKDSYRLTRLEVFLDLEDHWIKKTAAKLKSMGYFEGETHFNPKQRVTKAMLAQYLVEFIPYIRQLPSISDGNTTDKSNTVGTSKGDSVSAKTPNITDLTTVQNQVQRDAIRLVVEKGIINLDDQNQYFPNQWVTKAAAITAIVRASRYAMSAGEPRHVYTDVPPSHWAFPYVTAAVERDIVAPVRYLYPSRKLTKAELIALLSKRPELREELP